ncbi:MAG: excinuclease ABC subunit B [Chlamydiae bacterium SM23_39]|nr:MAG: excinuclease ABC subunit B [Chlamydiae bacterium SM23_39]
MFELKTKFIPCGDQGDAINTLTRNIKKGERAQVLLGITGSGKTFTMAHVINRIKKPVLILAHNKTLAAQLYQEFKFFFPNNAVEYFVSYYDYYQPEAYIPRTDTYIEKDLSINDKIDKMRLSATRSLTARKDVIIVSSVSCIYGLGLPEYYKKMVFNLKKNQKIKREDLLLNLVDLHYNRSLVLSRRTFRVRGDVVEIVLADEDDRAYRVEFFDNKIEKISKIDFLTGEKIDNLYEIDIYPASHYVIPKDIKNYSINSIKKELKERIKYFERENKLVERDRIEERTFHDIEMIKEIGFCKGIENYSRHFSDRDIGEPSPCLLDYFPKDFLLFIDESHQTIPQLNAMYNGDRSRKKALVEFGFRLPSAYDNRPLKFEEFYNKINKVIYVSATPSKWEIEDSKNEIIEQVIRPTFLLDPSIEVRSCEGQVDDILEEIRIETKKGGRVLVTVLTKKLAEELSEYLNEIDVKTKYLHSDINTLERIRIIKSLRKKEFDVLVGINLLREGLDIPEVSLVAVLDADKEGFLRSETSLIQICGRASRNKNGRVIMYADKKTKSIEKAVEITQKRRKKQMDYNKEHNIIPKTVIKTNFENLEDTFGFIKEKEDVKLLYNIDDIESKIKEYERKMKKAAKELKFKKAAYYRDILKYYQNRELIS